MLLLSTIASCFLREMANIMTPSGKDSALLSPVVLLPAVPPTWGLPPLPTMEVWTPACTACRERDRLVADLRHRVSQLEAQVERLTHQSQQAQRDGNRLQGRHPLRKVRHS